MVTVGVSPLRAWKTIEDFGALAFVLLQPQWVFRCKLNFRRRARLHTRMTAVIATIARAVICCQSMLRESSRRSDPRNLRIRCRNLIRRTGEE